MSTVIHSQCITLSDTSLIPNGKLSLWILICLLLITCHFRKREDWDQCRLLWTGAVLSILLQRRLPPEEGMLLQPITRRGGIAVYPLDYDPLLRRFGRLARVQEVYVFTRRRSLVDWNPPFTSGQGSLERLIQINRIKNDVITEQVHYSFL